MGPDEVGGGRGEEGRFRRRVGEKICGRKGGREWGCVREWRWIAVRVVRAGGK